MAQSPDICKRRNLDCVGTLGFCHTTYNHLRYDTQEKLAPFPITCCENFRNHVDVLLRLETFLIKLPGAYKRNAEHPTCQQAPLFIIIMSSSSPPNNPSGALPLISQVDGKFLLDCDEIEGLEEYVLAGIRLPQSESVFEAIYPREKIVIYLTSRGKPKLYDVGNSSNLQKYHSKQFPLGWAVRGFYMAFPRALLRGISGFGNLINERN